MPPAQRDHLTIVAPQFQERHGYLPRECWGIWADLKTEAELYDLPKARERVDRLVASSPTIGGWGTTKMVEALSHEVKPDSPSPAQFLGVPMVMPPPQPAQVVAPKRPNIIRRLLG